MSNPHNDSSKARKSAAKASQSTSTNAHEILENLLADNAAQKATINLLNKENERLCYTIGSRDLEIHDLHEELKDHVDGITALTSLFSTFKADEKTLAWYKQEVQRLVDAYNLLGRDYANLQTLNIDLLGQIKGLRHDFEVVHQQNDTLRAQVNKQQKQQEIINDLAQMLSLQQRIMSDVAGLK